MPETGSSSGWVKAATARLTTVTPMSVAGMKASRRQDPSPRPGLLDREQRQDQRHRCHQHDRADIHDGGVSPDELREPQAGARSEADLGSELSPALTQEVIAGVSLATIGQLGSSQVQGGFGDLEL